MAAGRSYRQKGDLRALNTVPEATYLTPTASTGTSAGAYAGTLDSLTPSDSETLTEVYAEGSRAVGTIYRTGVEYGFDAKFKHAKAASSRAETGWEQWIVRALGTSANATNVGAYAPGSFTAAFKTSANEQHGYCGCVVRKLVMSASE